MKFTKYLLEVNNIATKSWNTDRIKMLLFKIKHNKDILIVVNNINKLVKIENSNKNIENIKNNNYSAALDCSDGTCKMTQIYKTSSFGGQTLNDKGEPLSADDENSNVVLFNAGNYRKAESLQVAGMINAVDNKKITLKDMKDVISTIRSFCFTSTIDKYFTNEKEYARYSASIISILLDSNEAMKQLNFKPTGAIHEQIGDYYKLMKTKNYTNTSLTKENTADVVVYTGTNLLKNIENYELDYTDYIIKVMDGNTVKNTFVQCSLKGKGRIGDSKELTARAKKYYNMLYKNESAKEEIYQHIIDKGFKKFFQKIKGAATNTVSSVVKFVYKGLKVIQQQISRMISVTKDLQKNAKGYELSLMGLHEGLPSENEMYNFYIKEENFNKLHKTFTKTSAEIQKYLSAKESYVGTFGQKPITYNKKISEKELRLFYYNVISVLTLRDYLADVHRISPANIERSIVYGNTILPLVKIYTGETHVLNKLPIIQNVQQQNAQQQNIPVLGVKAYTSQSAKSLNYRAIQLYILSTVETDELQYLSIQLRSKSARQYVIDGNKYISESSFQKIFSK